MEPTKEQIQWFWEECGIENVHYRTLGSANEKWVGWVKWDGLGHTPVEVLNGMRTVYLPIDLNNLFKYAVPKLDYAELNYDYRQSQEEGYKITHSDFVYTAVAVLDVAAEHRSTCEDKDPALALFWAIYKAFGVAEVTTR